MRLVIRNGSVPVGHVDPARIEEFKQSVLSAAKPRLDGALEIALDDYAALVNQNKSQEQKGFGLGDMIHAIAKPIAVALGLPCIDKETKELKPESDCAKRREAMNKIRLG